MEAIFQFVDEMIEAQRDTYCAIADDIWDHPETRFEEFWSAQRLADALEAEGFQLTRDAGGSRMLLSPASARANRSLPCSANLTPWRDSASRPTAQNRPPRHREPTATVAGTICSVPRLSPRRSPPKPGCSSTAARARCAFTVVPARKADRENLYGARRVV